MDLPTCPSCGQSVLDENPQTCPFCGSSMTAKPGQKPAPAPKKGGAKASPSKTAKPPAGPSPAGAKKKPPEKKKEDDPFAFKTESHDASVRVALKPAKGRTYEVVCPMCETKGYIPQSAAGTNVRCANPSCMVPVFEAPAIKVEEKPVEEPKSKLSPVVLIVGVVFLGIIGYNVWFFLLRTPEEVPTINLAPLPDQNVNTGTPGGVAENSDKEAGEKESKPVVKQFDAVAFRKQLLDVDMLDIAQSRERNGERNRSPEFCRQVLTECYARLGMVEQARQQLPFIDRGKEQYFFQERLPPLVEILWRELDSKTPSDLNATLEEARKSAAASASVGRGRFDRFTGLAAVLVAADRADEARELVRKAWDDANVSDERELMLLRQASSYFRVLRDLPDAPYPADIANALERREYPEWVTVTMLLAGHNRASLAADWIRSSRDERVRSDCLTALCRWGTVSGRYPLKELEAITSEQPDVTKVRVFAAASTELRRAENTSEADRLLKAAEQAAAGIGAAEEFLLPEPARVLTLPPVDPRGKVHDVQALAALADSQHQAGNDDAAWASTQRALAVCRAIGPSSVIMAQFPRRLNDPGADAVQQELEASLNLSNANAVRREFNNFTAKLNDFEPLAEERLQLTTEIVEKALDWNMAPRVWAEIRTRVDDSDPAKKEPFLQSALILRVQRGLEEAKDSKALGELKLRLDGRTPAADPFDAFEGALAKMEQKESFDGYEAALQQWNPDRNRLEVLLLNRSQALAEAGKLQLAAELLDSLPNSMKVRDVSKNLVNIDLSLLREELYFFLGRTAAARGEPREMKQQIANLLPTPTEEISILAGIVLGLDTTPPKKTEPGPEKSPKQAAAP